MRRGLVASILALAVASSACTTPVAVGAMVAGGGSLVVAKVVHKPNCDGEGCIYGNLLAALFASLGVGLIIGGGIGLALDRNSTE